MSLLTDHLPPRVTLAGAAAAGQPGAAGSSVLDDRIVAPRFVLPTHLGAMFDSARPPVAGPPSAAGLPMLVIFFRGHWCPYCRRYLSKLTEHFDRIAPIVSHMVGISPEPVETSARLAGELGIPFPLLSDLDGRIIDAFGVRNGFLKNTLLPHPAVFVLSPVPDPAGQREVLFKSIDRNYKKRTTIRTIVLELQRWSVG